MRNLREQVQIAAPPDTAPVVVCVHRELDLPMWACLDRHWFPLTKPVVDRNLVCFIRIDGASSGKRDLKMRKITRTTRIVRKKRRHDIRGGIHNDEPAQSPWRAAGAERYTSGSNRTVGKAPRGSSLAACPKLLLNDRHRVTHEAFRYRDTYDVVYVRQAGLFREAERANAAALPLRHANAAVSPRRVPSRAESVNHRGHARALSGRTTGRHAIPGSDHLLAGFLRLLQAGNPLNFGDLFFA